MFWFTFISTLFLDQLSKVLATDYFEVVFNAGISFSWLQQLPTNFLTAVLLILAVAFLLILKNEWLKYPGLSGIFWGGAVSNLVDRILFGGVQDWLPLPWLGVTNNLADVFMSGALALIMLRELRHYLRKNNEN